jgi:Fe2+ transport system protein B
MKCFKKLVQHGIILILLTFPMHEALGNNLNNAGNLLDSVGTRAGVNKNLTLADAVGTGIGIVLSFVGLIFLVFMVYAGVLWLTARGEESQIDKSKKIIASTIIGLVLTISAYAITFLVTSRFSS